MIATATARVVEPESFEVYTVSSRPEVGACLDAREGPERVLEVAVAVISVVGRPGALIVFPAGLARISTAAGRLALAEGLAARAASRGAAIVFGIDQAPPSAWEPLAGPARPYLFACDGAVRRLWDVQAGSVCRDLSRPATVVLAGHRVGVLAGAEAFNRAAHRRLRADRPDLIAVLTHAGPTERWSHGLARLRSIAPVVASGGLINDGSEEPGRRRACR